MQWTKAKGGIKYCVIGKDIYVVLPTTDKIYRNNFTKIGLVWSYIKPGSHYNDLLIPKKEKIRSLKKRTVIVAKNCAIDNIERFVGMADYLWGAMLESSGLRNIKKCSNSNAKGAGMGFFTDTLIKYFGAGGDCCQMTDDHEAWCKKKGLLNNKYQICNGHIYEADKVMACEHCAKITLKDSMLRAMTSFHSDFDGEYEDEDPDGIIGDAYIEICRNCASSNAAIHNCSRYWKNLCVHVNGYGLVPRWYVEENEGDAFFIWDSDGEWHREEEPEPPENVQAEYKSEHRPWLSKEFIKIDRDGEYMNSPFHQGAVYHPRSKLMAPLRPSYVKEMVYGVELEIMAKRNVTGSVAKVCRTARDLGLIAEHDGSLDDDYGIEVVGPPLRYCDYAATDSDGKYNGLWARFLSEIYGTAIGWKAGTQYGMHISVNASAMTTMQRGKFNYLINNSRHLCETIAGRKQDDYETQYFEYRDETSLVQSVRPRQDKYTASGIASKDTECRAKTSRTIRIEVRIFRSSILYERMFRNIQFCDSVVQYVGQCSLADSGKYTEYLAWLRDQHHAYPNLCKFLVEKKLMNQPAATRTKLNRLVLAADLNET